MKIRYGLFFFILISFFLDCRPAYKRTKNRQSTQQIQRIKRVSAKRGRRTSFELCVEGIECEFCAQSVIDIVKKHHGVDIRFANSEEYEHSPLCFTWISKQKNFDIAAIKRDIDWEGFEFISIKGRFYGKVSEQDSFLLDDLDVWATIQECTKKISFKKSIALVGKLSFDAATERYSLKI